MKRRRENFISIQFRFVLFCCQLNDNVRNVLPSLHVGLQEALVRLLSRDARKRPNAQLLSSIKYFRQVPPYITRSRIWGWGVRSSLFSFLPFCSDPAVHALQFLDVINMKDPGQKSQFYRTTLKDILPCIPKVYTTSLRILFTSPRDAITNDPAIPIETLVPARLAEPPAGAKDAGSPGGCPPAHPPHDPGDVRGGVPHLHHAHDPADPGRAQIHPGERDPLGESSHPRGQDPGGGPPLRDPSHALLLFRVHHSSSPGLDPFLPLFCFFTSHHLEW